MKSPTTLLSSSLGFTWATSRNTISELAKDGFSTDEAKSWLEYKRSELNFTATIGTLLASVVATSLSWPGMSETHWIVSGFWYNATILSILSAVMAFHQASSLGVVLAKVCNGHELGEALLQVKAGAKVPSLTAIFVLQAPIQTLTYGIASYLLGLVVYVIYPVSKAGGGYPSDDAKIALLFGILLAVNCSFFVTALVLLQRLVNSL
ncbi:uncharacterized protein BDV14DRAFT_198259 [Aspergillus stella-maris]|uniref:uncharacterized protein n=1 Tax=Aspergillus stella-maris TaxID=1810926 RepID=UPI003CCD6DC2